MVYPERIERTDKRLISKLNNHFYRFKDIVGTSQTLNQAIEFAKQIAKSEYNILLTGESGTGKELFAQAIHNHGCFKEPFVAINCASIPRSLIESELFGYDGGAFTGANRNGQLGKIEAANNGTLFLDEIGDLPLEVQPVLLRVLEDKKIVRINSNKYTPVNFRLIAATNQNLFQMVQDKSFRNDLYYRISVFKIDIPPLRNRAEDIILLTHYFVDQICNQIPCDSPKFSPEVYDALLEYSWPGNIRQLKNVIIYAIYKTQNGMINICDLPDEIKYTTKNFNDLPNVNSSLNLKEMEKKAIMRALTQNHDKDKAARMLGISRPTLYRKITKYGIKL